MAVRSVRGSAGVSTALLSATSGRSVAICLMIAPCIFLLHFVAQLFTVAMFLAGHLYLVRSAAAAERVTAFGAALASFLCLGCLMPIVMAAWCPARWARKRMVAALLLATLLLAIRIFSICPWASQ